MPENILIVDPEAGAVEVVRQYLEEEGFACVSAESPRQAIQALENGGFSLLISEMTLPRMSGLELMQRARELCPDIGLLIMTAAMDVGDAIEAMRLGAHNFLLKPFHISDLAFNIDNVLERRRLQLENREYQTKLEERVREATLELQRTNDELRKTKEYLQNLLESSVDAILTISPEQKTIAYANRGAEEMLGYGVGQLEGRELAKVLAQGTGELDKIIETLRDGPIRNYETVLHSKRGKPIPVIASISFVRDRDGNVVSTLATCKDVTKQKQLEAELKEMTIKDSLTGLYNQRYFHQRLGSEIERSRRQRHPLSLLMFDVDQFKSYNDACGHLAGDEVLKCIGDVVRDCTRDHVDMGFRYGGDEFTVILPETGITHARRVAERIRAGFEARHFGNCTLSVGLMTYHKDTSPEAFVHFADQMMYGAKRSGGNRVYVYDPKTEKMIIERSGQEE